MISIYVINNCWLVADLLLTDFGPYWIFMNVRVVITLVVIMLLRDFGHYGGKL
jgi:hypothetical protein